MKKTILFLVSVVIFVCMSSFNKASTILNDTTSNKLTDTVVVYTTDNIALEISWDLRFKTTEVRYNNIITPFDYLLILKQNHKLEDIYSNKSIDNIELGKYSYGDGFFVLREIVLKKKTVVEYIKCDIIDTITVLTKDKVLIEIMWIIERNSVSKDVLMFDYALIEGHNTEFILIYEKTLSTDIDYDNDIIINNKYSKMTIDISPIKKAD